TTPAQPLETLKENFRNPHFTRIALPVTEGMLFIETEEIMYMEADGAYTNVTLLNGERIVVSKHLKQLEELLSSPLFFRPHRSWLINVNRVRRFFRQDGGYIEMDDNAVIPLSRTRREAFLHAFNRF
ncbi:MAG: LytTR family DNA-binding domain-containing protein, partial [Bacteroidota bacterium]